MADSDSPQSSGLTPTKLGVIAVIGFASSIGFSVSGMTNPGSIMNFMDLKKIPAIASIMATHFGLSPSYLATWDPSVLIVFCTALGAQLPLFQLLIRGRKQSIFGNRISFPTASTIDLKLCGGAALFGIGWALTGFCPGPAMTSAFAGVPGAAIFLSAVAGGMALSQLNEANFDIKQYLRSGNSTGLWASIGGIVTLCATTLAIAKYYPLHGAKSPTGPLYPWKFAVTGGIIIATAGILYNMFFGKVMGLSGMLNQQLVPKTSSTERWERWTFLAGLAAGSIATRYYNPAAFVSSAPIPPMWRLIVGGLLVGAGTSCSNGCTSGHGLAGISRLSLRSVVATATFFCTNMLVSTLLL